MIFFDQFKMYSIKFGKCFAEFMIPIIRSLAVKNLLRLLKSVTCEDALAKRKTKIIPFTIYFFVETVLL